MFVVTLEAMPPLYPAIRKTPSSDGASRGCGMPARWLATAQNPTLAAEGRTANQGEGEWHFGAAGV